MQEALSVCYHAVFWRLNEVRQWRPHSHGARHFKYVLLLRWDLFLKEGLNDGEAPFFD